MISNPAKRNITRKKDCLESTLLGIITFLHQTEVLVSKGNYKSGKNGFIFMYKLADERYKHVAFTFKQSLLNQKQKPYTRYTGTRGGDRSGFFERFNR